MFSNIDKIYCINLREREDRFNQVSEEFKKLGILDDVQFHRPERHEKGGSYGCFESHMYCMNDAFEKGFENIIIFEDDAKVYVNEKELSEQVAHVNDIITNHTFERINLGYVHALYNEKNYTHYYNGLCTVTTASVINRKFLEKIAYFQPCESCHTIDDYFCYLMKDNYILKKPIFIQRISESDNPWDNGQEKYKKIWEDININKTINYESFQKENHDLQFDSQEKYLHALHIILKYSDFEKEAVSKSDLRNTSLRRLRKVINSISNENLLSFFSVHPNLKIVTEKLFCEIDISEIA